MSAIHVKDLAPVNIGKVRVPDRYHSDMTIASGAPEPASPLSGDERGLLLRIARCPPIAEAIADASHGCRRVVAAQRCPEPERQVPEGWAGNLREARVMFVIIQPEHQPAGAWPARCSRTVPGRCRQ